MPAAFVTGGTGFLGLNLIEQLLAESWEIVALHRPTSNLKHLREKDIQLVEGSITEPESLITMIPEKVDAVFHVAGNTNMWSPLNHIQTRDNVEGTQNMVAAALQRQAKRFIHTSSITGYGHHRLRIDEKTQSNAIHSPINYFRTKYLAEMEVRKGIEKGLDAVMINPTHIIGPYDYHNWSQLFILIDRQKLPGVPQATQTFCHVREVAKAHIAAFHRGKKGENYIIGGVETDYLNLVQEIGDILGKNTPKRTTPGWILKLLGKVSLWGSYITGKEPDLTPEKAVLITSQILCNSQKAENELDYHSEPLRIMLEDCYQWMLREGLIGNQS
ncbi:SDR family oxidoreductase [Thermodesulfobacteriota bacterium]